MTRRIPTAGELRQHIDSAQRLLDTTRTKLDEAITRAQNDTDDGHKPPSTAPNVAGTTDPDLFNRAFTRIGRGDTARWIPKKDAVRQSLATLIRSLEHAEICAAAAIEAATDLCALDPENARQLLAATDTKSCANCSRPVAGTRLDPFRAGRCHDCYRYRLTHDGAERPRQLWVY